MPNYEWLKKNEPAIHTPTMNQVITNNPGLQQRPSFKDVVEKHLWAINIATFALMVLLCVSYMLVVTDAISKGYQMRDIEVQLQELTIQNQHLDVQARESQSLEHVSRSVKMLGLVRSGQPDYLTASEASYALAQ